MAGVAILETAIKRYAKEYGNHGDNKVLEAITTCLHEKDSLLLSSGAVKLMNSYISANDYAEVHSLPAFTSVEEFTDWIVFGDEEDWEDEEERLVYESVDIGTLLSYVAKAGNLDACIILNNDTFRITREMAQKILEENYLGVK